MNPFEGLKYFTRSEFDSPDLPGSGEQMNRDFLLKLETIRERVGRPLRITSGFRTFDHNFAIKGAPNSAHLRGFAADISASNSEHRFAILQAALGVGFRRIEIAPLHIHVDTDSTLPQDVCVFLASYK